MAPHPEIDRMAEILYNTWREPPSLPWQAVVAQPPSIGQAQFVARWRRVAAVVLQTAEQMVGKAVLTRRSAR